MLFKQALLTASLALWSGSVAAQLNILGDLLDELSSSATTFSSVASPPASRQTPTEKGATMASDIRYPAQTTSRSDELTSMLNEISDGTSQGLKRDILGDLAGELLPELAQSSSASTTPASATPIPTPSQTPSSGFSFEGREKPAIAERQLNVLDSLVDELVPELAPSSSSATPSPATATPTPSPSWTTVLNKHNGATPTSGSATPSQTLSTEIIAVVEKLVGRNPDLLGSLVGELVPELAGSSSVATPTPSPSVALAPVPNSTFQVKPSAEKGDFNAPAPTEPALLRERQKVSSVLFANPDDPSGEVL